MLVTAGSADASSMREADDQLSVPSHPSRPLTTLSGLYMHWAVDWEEFQQAVLTLRARLTERGAVQILTPAPDNLLAKRLAEKESMTSISVGNGLDTPAGMRYPTAPSSTLLVAGSVLWGTGVTSRV